MNNKLSKLESIRGFAAVYVVLHHSFASGIVILGYDISFLFRFGQEAVILFFFLSGFVIQYSFLNSRDKSFKSFFLKRFLRIYIPLFIVFLTNYLILWVQHNKLPTNNLWNIIGNILMLQDNGSLKPNVICEPFLGNSPLWSLSYEWWFYILFILVSLNVKENVSNLIYAIGTISAITYLIYPNFINRELMYLIIWWIGTDIARLYIRKQKISFKSLSIPLYILGLNILILFVNIETHKRNITAIGRSPILEFRHFSFAFLCLSIAVLWQKINWIGFNQTFGLFEKIAPISFGIYISHWFLITSAHYFDFLIQNKFFLFCAYSVFCLIFSYSIEIIIYPWVKRLLNNSFA